MGMVMLAGAVAALSMLALSATPTFAGPIVGPLTAESSNFLMIGMGNSASTDDAINVNSSRELGANTEFLATSNPNTRSVFWQDGKR